MNVLPPETRPPIVPKPVSPLRTTIAGALLCLGIALQKLEGWFGPPELNWPRFFFSLLVVVPVFIVGFAWLLVEGFIVIIVLWKKRKADDRTDRGQHS